VHKETYIALVFDNDNSSLLYTRMIVMSLNVSIDNVLKKMINNLSWSRSTISFVNYIYCSILFLSMLVNIDTAAKSSIQFVS